MLRRFVKTPATHSTLAQAYRTFRKECGAPQADHSITLSIDRGDEQWEFDRVEEFLELYATGPCHAVLKDESPAGLFSFRDKWDSGEVTVRLDSLAAVQRTIRSLDSGRADRKPFTVFVGPCRDPLWHVLVSHLRDPHDFRVITFESITEFGQPATQVLDLAARSASVAILVHKA